MLTKTQLIAKKALLGEMLVTVQAREDAKSAVLREIFQGWRKDAMAKVHELMGVTGDETHITFEVYDYGEDQTRITIEGGHGDLHADININDNGDVAHVNEWSHDNDAEVALNRYRTMGDIVSNLMRNTQTLANPIASYKDLCKTHLRDDDKETITSESIKNEINDIDNEIFKIDFVPGAVVAETLGDETKEFVVTKISKTTYSQKQVYADGSFGIEHRRPHNYKLKIVRHMSLDEKAA